MLTLIRNPIVQSLLRVLLRGGRQKSSPADPEGLPAITNAARRG